LSSLTEERDQLKTNLNEMTEEKNQLKTNLNEMTEERNQLKTNLNEMTEENNRLQCLFRLNKTCPAGWTKFSCSCYFLSTESGSWTEGRQDCRTRGADLVVIDSDEEQTFLSNFTKEDMWSWIGLTDGEQENSWKWIDGTPLTLSYWEEDQPDNGGGDVQWGEEDCAHIRTGKKTKDNWNDRSCKASLHWICEKKAYLGLLSTSLLAGLIGFGVYYHTSAAAELSIKTNLAEERDVLKSCLFEMTEKRDLLECLCRKKKTCPPGWTKSWCSCYFLSTDSGSWKAGREDCRSRGADLVVIDSIEEQTFLSTFTNMSTWIGLSDKDKEGTWKWVDGTLLTVMFWFWASNQPDNGNGVTEWGEEHCVHILGSRSSERRLPVAAFLCLGLLSVFLLIGLIGLRVHYHTSVGSLTEERDQLKTNLSEMTEERDQLKTNLTEMTEERDQLKTNLTKMTQEDNYFQSLCRQKTTCPDGWTKFCCSCYFLSTESGSWTEGREDCRTRGADLVVIDSAEEQAFLSELIHKYTWIGLNDRDEEGTWKWVDGTPLTVTYWASNNPNNGEGHAEWGEEDCVEIFGGQSSEWNDISCEASRQWICEKPAQP
ncbi:uncharacterized protein LOC113173469, partial [Anabas testudineus]|uniref:uncharacterized protein LOC113173469 n=1 Tax=Anabas testudineus TaxID=64144 RepID=UPI000E45433C